MLDHSAHRDQGIATGVVNFSTAMDLFNGQSAEFFAFLLDLAEDADEAQRGVRREQGVNEAEFLSRCSPRSAAAFFLKETLDVYWRLLDSKPLISAHIRSELRH